MRPRTAASRTSSSIGPGQATRREFLVSATVGLTAVAGAGCETLLGQTEPITDIHQHVSYMDRPDDVLLAHQRIMGVTKTILLPAGRPVNTASTHQGLSNGLQAKCLGNEACYRFAKANPKQYLFAANEVPDIPSATEELEKYLKLGAVAIAEQKFGVDCDSPEMQRIYQLAQEYDVPILMHWQVGMYNYGFERFYKMLERFPNVRFLGHAQTWWANLDKNYQDDPKNLYPKGKITLGGRTDRYLSDYPNMFGDLSAGSGLNALTRDEDFARDFIQRHPTKLLYGSDCNDHAGAGPACQGSQTLAAVRRLAPNKKVERQLLYDNARRVFKL